MVHVRSQTLNTLGRKEVNVRDTWPICVKQRAKLWQADSLEERLRREITIGRVARIVEQMHWESHQDLGIHVDETVARILQSLESMEEAP